MCHFILVGLDIWNTKGIVLLKSNGNFKFIFEPRKATQWIKNSTFSPSAATHPVPQVQLNAG